jgi:CRP/FNR family transcriptional regulator
MTEKDLAKYFPSFEKELLSEIMEFAEIRTAHEDEIIVRTGQNIRSAILVIKGLLKIYRQDDEGGEYFMYYLDEGKACAMSLVCALGKGISGVKAKATRESTILIIPPHYVDEWIGKYKSWARFAINTYRERFEELLLVIDHVVFRNMDDRLVYYLKRHQEKLNTDIITTSFTEIAEELNSSREVISRLMKKLAEKGAIAMQGPQVRIVNLDKAAI